MTNTSDGSQALPAIRQYLNLMTLDDLTEGSSAPRTRDPEPLFAAIRRAGYQGVQFAGPVTPAQEAACRRQGLGRAGLGRVNEAREADELAARLAGEGQECGTVHLGWGMEDDDEAARLIEALLAASGKRRLPLYPETHRATVFQDLWRTVKLVRHFPELRFNGDFSHWYTGLEMVYGGFEKKLDFIRPVLERVRFVHGRIGNPGCIQVDVGDGNPLGRPYVEHFRMMWTEAFRSFRATAAPGDYILFVPELLSPRIYYARTLAGLEESDRWEQSLVLCGIAQECFAAAGVSADAA